MIELVHYEVGDDVATITLDSPHNRNALSTQLIGELLAHLQTAARDDSLLVLIRSADRVFCSGADLAEASSDGMKAGARSLVELQRAIVAHAKPVVIRLAGPVRAGGIGIVAAADVVVSADNVTFAFTESRLALAPAVISLTVLFRLTSRAAADTFLTGRSFDATEATAMGLVTRTAPSADLDATIADVCAELKKAHPQGLRETKALLARDLLRSIDDHGEAMASLSARLFASPDARQAMNAFLNRKK